MKNYHWILFDADETLFRFDAFSGLQHMFTKFDLTFTEEDYREYEIVNLPLWVQYQKGTITAEGIKLKRFETWANKLQMSALDLDKAYMAAMAEISTLTEGAENLLNALKGKAKVGIITNGFTELQQQRLERIGLQNHFDVLVISEEVGKAKPHREIFDFAFSKMGDPAREQVLIIGDSLESDIVGGINAGIDTCWLNAGNKPKPEAITPSYQVSSLRELINILGL